MLLCGSHITLDHYASFVLLLHCALSLAAQCTVIGPVCGFVAGCVCVFVGLLPR